MTLPLAPNEDAVWRILIFSWECSAFEQQEGDGGVGAFLVVGGLGCWRADEKTF
jgi:hypothetical protein